MQHTQVCFHYFVSGKLCSRVLCNTPRYGAPAEYLTRAIEQELDEVSRLLVFFLAGGGHEPWDILHSCAASCLSLAMLVILPRHLTASWPNTVALPGLVLVSVLPASAWVTDAAFYLRHRSRVQLAARASTVVRAVTLALCVGECIVCTG